MNKTPVLLAACSLLLGMAGCQTDEGVQKGYLTPDQTAPASASSSDAPASADGGPTTGERLPPPSVTQDVAKTETSSEAAPSSTPPADSPAPEPTSNASATSPAALAKNDQSPGGKVGTAGSSLRREKDEDRDEEPEPQPSSRDEDKDETAAKAPSSSAVSSNLSPGSTRVLVEPTGSAKGVILRVNSTAKFVVIKFQYRAVPTVGKVLSVMRNGVKVGQIRMTKPIKAPHGTADIIEGDLQRGDTVE